MLKSMLIHKRDNKRTVKSNFVISYLAFKGVIPKPSPLSSPKLVLGKQPIVSYL